jgi:hypothetical protein
MCALILRVRVGVELLPRFLQEGSLFSVVIVLVTVGVYWNTLGGGFVLDDVLAIERNDNVNPGKSDWADLFLNDLWGHPIESVLTIIQFPPSLPHTPTHKFFPSPPDTQTATSLTAL